MESGREEGIENEGEREREMGMAHLAAAERTNQRATPNEVIVSLSLKFSQMAAVAVYNNVLIGPKRSSVVWDLDSHLKGRFKISEEVESSGWIYAIRNTMDGSLVAHSVILLCI